MVNNIFRKIKEELVLERNFSADIQLSPEMTKSESFDF
jgi:hypothetical protein